MAIATKKSLIDIVLVLLIAFLVTAPLSLHILRTSLDWSHHLDPADPGPIHITFYVDGKVIIRDGTRAIETYRINLARELVPVLDSRTYNKTVVVEIAPQVRYGDAIGVVDTIKGVGARDISLALR